MPPSTTFFSPRLDMEKKKEAENRRAKKVAEGKIVWKAIHHRARSVFIKHRAADTLSYVELSVSALLKFVN